MEKHIDILTQLLIYYLGTNNNEITMRYSLGMIEEIKNQSELGKHWIGNYIYDYLKDDEKTFRFAKTTI